MPKKNDTFKLGITVIVMFIMFFFSLLFVAGRGLSKPEETIFIVRFSPGSPMSEIGEGSFVTYFGQKVGKVIDARFVEDVDPNNPELTDQHLLEVRATLRADLELRKDCKIVATGPPLGGKGTLDIISRGISPEAVEPEQPVYGQTAGFQAALDLISNELDEKNPDGLLYAIKLQLDGKDTQSLIFKIRQSIDDINAMTASLETELQREHDETMLFKLHASLDQLHQGFAEITALLKDNRPRIDRTLTSVDNAATRFDRDIVAVIAEEFELAEPSEATLLSKVHDAFTCLNQSLADIKVVAGEAKGIVVLNKDRIGEVVESAVDASTHLKQGVKDLKLHPWKLLFQPSDAEKRELHLLNMAREFAEAAAHLDDATSRLKALIDASEGQISIDNPDLQNICSDLESTVKRYSEAEDVFWKGISSK